MRAPSSRAPSLALAGLVAAAAAVLAVAGRGIPTPWILIDELLHSELARGLRRGDGFSVRGHGMTVSYLYPALLAPFAWSYGAMKVVNAVVISLGAVPVYLWARRLVRPWVAVAAGGLTLLLPSLLFSGELMLENLFFPLFLAACLAIALALEQPTQARQALAVGMILLATITRVQGLLLFAVFALSAFIVRRDALRKLAPSLAIAFAAGIVVNVRLALGNLGVYEVQARAGYSASGILGWLGRSFGELALSVGIVPVAALIALVASRSLLQLRDRIFVAVTATATGVLVALAAVAASWEPAGLKERYMFYVAPLLLLALLVWIERGAVHPWWAVAIPAALVVVLPLGRLFREPALLGNAWALLPFERAGLTTARILLVVGAAGASALFLLAPRFAPVGVAVFLLASSVVVYSTIRNQSRAVLALSGLHDKSWLRGRPAVYLNATNFEQEARAGRWFEEWVPVWETEFWNRSFAGVLSLGAAEPAPFFQRNGTLDWRTGRISGGAGITNAIADARFVPSGTLLGRQGRLALWNVQQPLRFASVTEGVFADGTTTGLAAYSRWTGPRGRMEVRSSAPANVVVGRFAPARGGGGRVVGRSAAATMSTDASVPTPLPPFRVEVRAPAGTHVTFTWRAA
jgi:hypothetical protein